MRSILIAADTLLICSSRGEAQGNSQVPAGTSYAIAPLLRAYGNTAPTITSVTPASGNVGDSVTIYGSGFTGATNLGWEPLGSTDILSWSFTVNSDNEMTGINGGGPANAATSS